MENPVINSTAPDRKIEPYPIEIRAELDQEGREDGQPNDDRVLIKCKGCGKDFDSTFTSEEVSQLPNDQNESGTLHLCPHCGQLSIYLLKDYGEGRE